MMRVRRRAAGFCAALAIGALLLGGLVPPAVADSSAAVPASDDLKVRFAGSLVGTTAYTTAGDEQLRGSLRRVQGGEEQIVGTGVKLSGGTQGLRFEPSDWTLGQGTATKNFIAELQFTPTATPANLSTLLSAGGNFYVRAEAGQLRYGFNSPNGSQWTNNSASTAFPTLNQKHTLSLQYLPSSTGASLYVILDGKQLPTVTASKGFGLVSGGEKAFGFGNEVHPSGTNRGFVGSLQQLRVTTGPDAFDPKAFVLGDGGTGPGPGGKCTDLSQLSPGNYIPVSADDCDQDIVTKSTMVRPTAQQWQWQDDRLSAFVHFGINTFYNQEWGNGTEDPKRFNPTGPVNTDQWVSSLADAGFRRVILTVKHHDGFLLYPSRYTDYSVASSPWLDGKGDVVKQLTDSARKYGLDVGLYLSPADSNQEVRGVYGNGSAPSTRSIPTLVPGDTRAGQPNLPSFSYQATDYGAYFLNTLYEILTQYGKISEVWFDGSNGNTAKTEKYDYPAFYDLIGKLQPNAVVAVGGRDVRWVGNEAGQARADNEWSPLAVGDPADKGKFTEIIPTDAQALGDRPSLISAVRQGANTLHWWPAEADFKLTQGWFAHPNDKPLTGKQQLQKYEESVGRNAVFLMNVPPTTNGSFSAASVQALKDFKAERDKAYATDFARGRDAVSADGSVVRTLTDDNPLTSWSSGQTGAGSVTVDLGAPKPVKRISLAENVLNFGQTAEKITIEAEQNGTWKEIGQSGAVGQSRILVLPATVTAQKFRLSVKASRAPVQLATLSLWGESAVALPQPAETYLDCSASRAGDGSRLAPFNSLEQLRQVTLAPGSFLRIKSGTDCAAGGSGIWGYGTAQLPITATGYAGTAEPSIGGKPASEVLAPYTVKGWQLSFGTPVP
jgi:alpha-L-fucosidase